LRSLVLAHNRRIWLRRRLHAGAAIQLAVTWFASRDLRAAPAELSAFRSAEILSKPGMYLALRRSDGGEHRPCRAFATHAGSGMAAALDYSMRCVNVVIAYLVYPVANSLMPEIARLRATGDTAHAYRLMSRSVGLMAIAVGGFLRRGFAAADTCDCNSFSARQLHRGIHRTWWPTFSAGLAPCLIGWTLMDLISRCCFALDRPWLPVIAAVAPVSVNLLFLATLRWRGQRGDPVLLGLGPSMGLLAGFLVLFAMARMVVASDDVGV
jgi:peptidoglycan biosynthesis protein MviN/MurJ (putative lipid II flippase)